LRTPVIVVTGPIASGKTTVAKAIAGRRGVLVDCDRIGHQVIDREEVKSKLIRYFGKGILDKNGKVARKKLAEIAFSSPEMVEKLNRAVKPVLKREITSQVLSLREKNRYIVLDAVLFFKYKFRFKVDLIVVTIASPEIRLKRLMRRDGVDELHARERIEIQSELEEDWSKADYVIDTSKPINEVLAEAERIRERFLARFSG